MQHKIQSVCSLPPTRHERGHFDEAFEHKAHSAFVMHFLVKDELACLSLTLVTLTAAGRIITTSGQSSREHRWTQLLLSAFCSQVTVSG